jgi:hypothetical protein
VKIDAAFASLAQAPTAALFVGNDYFFNSRITQLVALEAQYAVPTELCICSAGGEMIGPPPGDCAPVVNGGLT